LWLNIPPDGVKEPYQLADFLVQILDNLPIMENVGSFAQFQSACGAPVHRWGFAPRQALYKG